MKYIHFLILLMIAPFIYMEDSQNNIMNYPLIPPTCSCPHTCNNIWRGNGECNMECNIPECNWDDGDCDEHLIGICRGNITIENIETGGEKKGLL